MTNAYEEAARQVKVAAIVDMLVDRFPLIGLTETLRAMHEGQRLTIARYADAAGRHRDRVPSDETWAAVCAEIQHCERAYVRGATERAA